MVQVLYYLDFAIMASRRWAGFSQSLEGAHLCGL